MAKEIMTPEELIFAEEQMEREALHHATTKASKHWAIISALTVLLSYPVFLVAGKLHSGQWFWETAATIEGKAVTIARLTAENTRLSDSLSDSRDRAEANNEAMLIKLKRKAAFRNETQKAMMGFLMNRTNLLESATTVNPYRDSGFPFRDWQPVISEMLVEQAMRSYSIDSLKWVVSQPEWHTILSTDLVNRVRGFIKEYAQVPSAHEKE